MKPRSPVLGYNHNVRYASRLWHVQTEDSGVQAPHIYTHLFHDGTILASKKLDYDASSDVTAVQKLMQSQHKLMLRELKSGVFDDKIEKFFGPIVREAEDANEAVGMRERADTLPSPPPVVEEQAAPAVPEAAPPGRPRSPEPEREDNKTAVPNLGPLLPPPPAQPPTAQPAARRQASLTPARPAVAVPAARSGTNHSPPPTIGGRSSSSAQVPRSPPPTIGSGRSGAAQTNKPTAEGVIVARPTVIVGGKDKGEAAADFWKTTERRQQPETTFGGDLISEKSLDEVILAYLSEDGTPKK